MGKNLTAFFMAWGNFTVIPCPARVWDSAEMKRMLAWLPSVGAVIAVLWTAACRGLSALTDRGLPAALAAAAAEYLLFRLTGYMHLDGFMDVSDAVMSRRDLETRQRILKDSRVGSFAVVQTVFLLLAWFAALSSADFTPALFLIPVMSRAASGLFVLRYPAIGASQYRETGGGANGGFEAVLLVQAAAWFFAFPLLSKLIFSLSVRSAAVSGMAVTAAEWGIGYLACRHARKQLGGMNGDIAGYTICMAELAGMICLAAL